MAEAQQLIDAIAAEPRAVGPWLAYANWLHERGDPRGELIELQVAAENIASTYDIQVRIHQLQRDAKLMLSPRLLAQAQRWQLTLERGFIRRAAPRGYVDNSVTEETVAALLADPHAVLLHGLTAPRTEHAGVVFAAPRRHLRDVSIPGIGALGERLGELAPTLEVLSFREPTPALVHPRLRTLTTQKQSHIRVELPSLADLTTEIGADVAQPGSLLAESLPALRTLIIRCDRTVRADSLAALAACAFACRLTDLRIAGLPHTLVDAFIAQRGQFAQLKKLDISFEKLQEPLPVELVAALCQRIETAFAGVNVYISRVTAWRWSRRRPAG